MRCPLTLSLALVLGLAGTASGAPASCRLLVDAAHDDRVGPAAPPPADTAGRDGDLDLLGADVASDGRWVTAVVRTRTQRGATSPDSPTGRVWELRFTVGSERYAMVAATGPEGYEAFVSKVTGQRDGAAGTVSADGMGGARVVILPSKNAVRISAPVAHFAPHTPLRKGTVLRDLAAWSYRFYGVGGRRVTLPANRVVDYGLYGVATSIDSATTTRTYTVGTKSCVTPGL